MSVVRAPGEDGSVLCIPGFQDLPGLVRKNQLSLARLPHPWAEMRAEARREVLGLLGFEPGLLERPWVASGHQPEICHPGVWAKYFATKGLCNAVEGFSFNLVADGDLCRQIWIPFPEIGTAKYLSRAAIRVGLGLGGRPWELVETHGACLDWNPVWQSLRDRLGMEPFGRTWLSCPQDKAPGGESHSLSQFNTDLRQKGQRALGLDLPDIFQSALAQTKSFYGFVWSILRDMDRFACLHNEALASFRLKNGISNPGQPMADLKNEGYWQETPFWLLEKGAVTRRPLWMSSRNGGLVLGGASGEELIRLDGEKPDDWPGQLRQKGLGLRPRALTNTLFMRWFLCDLFVHGLGGAIYDQVTDQVGRAWIGVEPPGYALVTATLRLPLPKVASEDEKDLRRKMREVWWNPDRFTGDTGIGSRLLEEWRGLRRPGELSGSRKRIQAKHLLWQIHVEATDRYRELDNSIRGAVLARGSNRLATNREWPWVLYPGHSLRELLSPFMEGVKYLKDDPRT